MFGVRAVHCAVGGAERIISSWLQICSRSVGRWEEQPGSQVPVKYHLVCAHPGAWLQGRMEKFLSKEQHKAAGLTRLCISSHLCLCWPLKTSTIHGALHSWRSLTEHVQHKYAACLSRAWTNPSLTSYWLHTFFMPENPYREETRSTPSASSCQL